MGSNILLILGVAALSMSLRTCRSLLLQKLGVVGILLTSYLTGWLLTGHRSVGLFCALSWLMLPWLEILTRVRTLTLPIAKDLRRKTAPHPEAFPLLGELTEEIEGEHFEQIEDCGWDWDDHQQFFRLFYQPEERTQGAICLIDQPGMSFFYMSLSSRAKDGRIWTTWNYPFSYSLKLVPEWRINRLRGNRTFFELYSSHLAFLAANQVKAETLEPIDPEQVQTVIQNDLASQISHNIAVGLLRKTGSDQACYSWKGLLFVWIQFIRDLVRFS